MVGVRVVRVVAAVDVGAGPAQGALERAHGPFVDRAGGLQAGGALEALDGA
jgi:hypothetical protein